MVWLLTNSYTLLPLVRLPLSIHFPVSIVLYKNDLADGKAQFLLGSRFVYFFLLADSPVHICFFITTVLYHLG